LSPRRFSTNTPVSLAEALHRGRAVVRLQVEEGGEHAGISRSIEEVVVEALLAPDVETIRALLGKRLHAGGSRQHMRQAQDANVRKWAVGGTERLRLPVGDLDDLDRRDRIDERPLRLLRLLLRRARNAAGQAGFCEGLLEIEGVPLDDRVLDRQ